MNDRVTQRVHHLLTTLLQNMPVRPTLLLGLSGGADSVCLLRLLAPLHHEKKIYLHAVHINHGWRDSALHDQQFCQKLCTTLAIPFSIRSLTSWYDRIPPHKSRTASRESRAREARRLLFSSLATHYSADGVLLAHHANDQLETFFIRLLRGASLSGITGMRTYSGIYLRPLLTTTRADIEAWLSEHHQPFCHDETNGSDAHLRNRIRTHLIPTLLTVDDRAQTTLIRTMQHCADDEAILEALTLTTIKALHCGDAWYSCTGLRTQQRGLQRRIVMTLIVNAQAPLTPSTSLIDEIITFLISPRGGTHHIGPCTLEKKKNQFRIACL